MSLQPSLTAWSETPLTDNTGASRGWVMLQVASCGESTELTKQLTTVGPFQLQSVVDLLMTPLMGEGIPIPRTQQVEIHRRYEVRVRKDG